MNLADFRSLFSEEPKRTWRSGLGPAGGSWREQAVDDVMDDARFGAFQRAWRRGASVADLFGDDPFELKATVGAGNSANRRADVAKVETFLARTGHYKPLKEGPSGYVSNNLDEAIRAFQADSNLDVDGILKPGGQTISHLRKLLDRPGILADPGDRMPVIVPPNVDPKMPELREPFWPQSAPYVDEHGNIVIDGINPKTGFPIIPPKGPY